MLTLLRFARLQLVLNVCQSFEVIRKYWFSFRHTPVNQRYAQQLCVHVFTSPDSFLSLHCCVVIDFLKIVSVYIRASKYKILLRDICQSDADIVGM